MGGAQSAQREDKRDSTAEESGKVDDAQTEQHIEDKPLKNNGQISEISGKADGTIADVNGHCEDEIAAEAIVSPDEDVSEAEKPLKEETPLENLEINENESPVEADANEEVPLETIEMDAKHNDINESFRRFFSNINLKVTVKRGSAEKDDITVDVPDDTTKEEPNRPEGIDDTAKENKSEDAEHDMALNAVQETYHHDSTCPTLTDITSEDAVENAEEKTTETKEDAYSEMAGPTITVPVGDDEKAQQNATSEEEVVVSPIKRFFTSGIFSGLRKKKKSAEDETTEKELVDMHKVEAVETTEQPVEQEHDKDISLGIEAVTVEAQHKENRLKEEILSAASAQTTDEGKSASTDPSTTIMNEPEILCSQEKDKVQASPLKRLLSGSSFKKPSKKQREQKSNETKLSDSGEHVSNQLPTSTDAADNQKEESPAGEEDGAWASFKKLMTPKKRIKRSSLTNEETQNPSSVQESKSSEGEQISDHSTEESKKRKDSSVSWEAVLCGSGRRRSRSRKTSDSEDEKPQDESDNRKQESPLESSNEVDKSPVSYPKQAGSPSEGDGGSTWKSFKKLVTPKRKAKDEDIQSDGEVTQDDSSFSIKKLLPGQKKRKPTEKQDYASSDEADKEVASGDEDSETPAVVPLSEFDTVDTGVHLQTHADIESHVPKKADYELQQDLDKMAEPGLLCDSLQSEAKKVQDNEDALENETSTTPASNEEPDEITEVISKHQQLSDIPEEGIITETMVTPTSVTEQPARDDTIAEDLIEITSEAITAMEPVDITLADETEMISAVSQLSDSSKTSGNTTPVPAKYDVKDTEVLLQQVAENISTRPKADPLCSDEISSERVVASVSCQILETFVKQQPTILEIHRRSDATAIKTGLNVKELDAINELAATAKTQSITEVNEAVSTEIVSEVPTELDTAEIAVDEIHEVSVTHTEKSIKELESTNKSQDLMEYQSEYEAVSTEILSQSAETVECALVEARQAETETSQTDIQEETKDGGVEHEVQTVLETKDEIMQNITDQVQAEHQDQPCVVVPELQAAVETDTFNSEKDIIQSPENKAAEDIPAVETIMDEPKAVEPEKKDELQADEVPEVLAVQPAALDSQISSIQIPEKKVPLSEDIPPTETVTDEPKGQPEPLTEVHAEPEKEDELQADAAKTEYGQVPEVLAVQEAALDSEIVNIQTLGSKVQLSESIPTEEAFTDQCKEEIEPLTKIDIKPEKKQLQADAAKTEHGQLPEVLAVQEAALDSQISSIQIPEKEVLLSHGIEPQKAVTDEPKGQPELLSEFSVETENKDELLADSAKTEHGQVPEVLDVQEAALDSEMGNIQTLGRKVPLSDYILPAETVTGEPKGQPESLTQVNVEQEKKDNLQADAAKTEQVQVSQILGGVQATALVSQISSNQMPEKEITLSEDIKPEEADTDEPVIEVHGKLEKRDELQADAVQEAALDSVLGSIQTPGSKVPLSDNIPQEEAVTDKPKEETEALAEVIAEPEKEDELQAEEIKSEKAVTDELKEETEPVTEVNVELEKKGLQAEAAKTEQIQISEILGGEQETAIDSQIRNIQIPEKEVPLSEDIPPAGRVTDEPKVQPEPLTEVNAELKKKELQADAAKTEKSQVPEVLAVQEAALDSQISSEIPEKEVPLSEDISPAETVTDEPKVQPEPLTEVHFEPEKEDELQADAAKTEHVQVPEVLGAVQEAAVESQKTEQVQVTEILEGVQATALVSQISSTQISGKEVSLSEDIKPEEAVTIESKEETEPVTEVHVEPEKKLHADVDSEMVNIQTPRRKIPLSEDILPAETVPKETTEHVTVSTITTESEIKEPVVDATIMDDHQVTVALETPQVPILYLEEGSVDSEGSEPTQATEGNAENKEELPGGDAKTEHVQESKVLPCDVKDIVTETKSEKEISTSGCIKESVEGVSAQETEKQLLLEDIHDPDTDNVIASATESNLDLKINKDRTTEIIPQDVQVKQEDRIPEVVDKFQTLSAVHVSSVSEEKNRAQVLEKKVISEKTPAPCVDNATVTYENKYKVNLSEVQGHVEGEKEGELPGPEIKTSTVEHAVVAQVITCNLKEVSAAIPDVFTEKPSNIHEPFIDTVVSELEFKKEAETAIQLVKDDMTETATEGSVVVMMHVPSAEFEDNHRIQVQVVEVDIKSAEMNTDSVLEVGVTEAKEVTDVCHETIKVIDKLSATEETEEELINEENKIINHTVIQHVKENLPERVVVQTSIQDEVVNLEQEHKKQPDVTEVSEMAESKSIEVEIRKAKEDTSWTFSQRKDESHVISDDPAAKQSVSEDVMQTPNTPESLEAYIHDHKEDLEEHKNEPKKSEAGVTAEEVKLSSQGLEMKKINEETQTTQSSLSQTVTVSNTGLEVPQNTGIISSINNLESPSSLSLEFKLNIQFGQAKAPACLPLATEKTEASPPPATERTEPVKQTNVSEVGVQAVEPPKPVNETLENQKKTVLTDVTTEITEPKLVNLDDTTERSVIMKQPVLLDIGIQAMEKAQAAEQLKSTEKLTPSVPETEKIQAVMKTETFLGQPVLCGAWYEEIKVEESVKQIEEENDQDLWVDAEEDIQTQEESDVPLVKVEEPVVHQTESEEEEKAELEYKFEMAPETAPKSKTKEEESQQEMHKMGEICEIENEVEEFAVALEHPEAATTATSE